MEFLEIDRRDRTVALSLQGCHCGSGFVDSVGSRKAVGQEWFKAVQSVLSLCQLLIYRGQLSLSLFQNKSVILRVDFEKHIAFLYRLVVLHIQLDGLTAHTRRNAHDIGARSGVIGSWMTLQHAPDIKR